MGKQRAIKLNLNRTFTEKEFNQPDSLHIEDGNNKVGFTPACVFDEESRSGGRLRALKRLIFMLPSIFMFILGFQIEGMYQFLLLVGGMVALVIGLIFILIGLMRKSSRKLILFVDGCLNALRFDEKTEGLQIAWTEEEAREYVKKQIALEQERFKAMKTWQFIVIIGLLAIVMFILVKIGATIGAF